MKNMKYKLLTLDIDGTLVGKAGVITERTKDALFRAKEAGVTVSLCTGRAPAGCIDVLRELALDGYHTFHDGALVYNPETGHDMYHEALEKSKVRQAIAWAHRRDMELELYSAKQFYAERSNWSTDVHRDYFNIFPVFIDYDRLLATETIIKLQTVQTNDEEAAKIAEFSREFADKYCFSWVISPAFPGVYFINILSPQVSKGQAITHLAKHLGLRNEEVMAAGDGKNDISMLEAAGLGVAMGEAPAELRQVAGYVTGGVEEDGLAAAVERFILD